MPRKISPELKARAVRMVQEHQQDYPSVKAAAGAVAKQLGRGRENQQEPALRLDSLPPARFHAAAYEHALRGADQVAASNREPATRMRVRVPGPRWRNIRRAAQERRRGAVIGWLIAEAVVPSIGEAEGSYFVFPVSLDTAQDLLAGAASSQRRMNDQDRQDTIQALRVVETSEPSQVPASRTLDAVRCYLERLECKSPRPRSARRAPFSGRYASSTRQLRMSRCRAARGRGGRSDRLP